MHRPPANEGCVALRKDWGALLLQMVGSVMSDLRVVPIKWARMVVIAIEASGIDSKALCVNVGIDYECLWKPEAQVEELALLLLWKRAVNMSRNSAVGFSSGRMSLACFNWLSTYER